MLLRSTIALISATIILAACGSTSENNNATKNLPPIVPGHDIKVKIDGYDQDFLTLAYYYGDKTYVQDTAQLGADGYFNFKGEESLDEGVYMLVMAPDNNFLQAVISDREQRFTMTTSKDDLVTNMVVSGGDQNQDYFEYLKFLNGKIKERTAINEEIEATKDSLTKINIRKKFDTLNDEVRGYQSKLAKKYSPMMLGRMMAAEVFTEAPEFKNDEDGLKAFYFNRAHYFDNIDVSDEGLLRSPILANKVKAYMKNYIVQHPDSIAASIDDILSRASATDNFKYFLIDNLNKYASSKVVGMDAVYVHLVEKYYVTGQAWWTDPEELEKIIDNAQALAPILIGKPAPDLALRTDDDKAITVRGFDSEYTVLLFWDPDCSHCEKSMPDMIKFHDEFKDQGVEVLAICTVIGNDEEQFGQCAEKIKKHKMQRWTNASDQYHQSQFKKIYDIKSTPRIFVLDKDKKIIMKSIGADQLGDVMKDILKKDQNATIASN